MKQFYQLAMALVLPVAAYAQTELTVTMSEAGTLPAEIGDDRKMDVKSLKVIGDINGTDIAYIREMGIGTMNAQWQYESSLMILDLSEANIVEGGDPYNSNWPYPQTVANEIGTDMFTKFAALIELRLPDSATHICKNGLNSNIKLAELALPANLEQIDQWGVYWCNSLEELTIPSKTKLIEESAFYGCSMTKVTIESPDIELQPGAFAGLDKLVEIEISEENPAFSSKDGVLYSKDGTVLMLYPAGREDARFEIPAGVAEIAEYGFYGCGSLTDVVISEGVEKIGEYAFDGCTSLVNVEFPLSLTHIGNLAFAAGPKILNIELADTKVVEIGAEAFIGNNEIEVLTLPETLVTVNANAFSSAKYKELRIPASVRYIGASAFNNLFNSNLENVYAYGIEPAECDGDVFSQEAIASTLYQEPTAVLHVPEGCLEAYRKAEGYKYFSTIVDDIIGSVGVSTIESEDTGVMEYYNLSGCRVENPGKGIYVVRLNGKTHKVTIE